MKVVDVAVQQIWSDRRVLTRALGQELASVSFFLDDDLSSKLPACLSLHIVARVVGAQIGETRVQPLQNGAVHMPLLQEIGGTLEGRIDNCRALNTSGSNTGWDGAVATGFTLTALGDVTLPLATIAKFVPLIGGLLAAALALVGNKVTVAIAHDDVVVHLPRTA
ncbi:MAG: hypothetical protein M3R53_03560 [Candidatus Eremiobacteraeota bacterium]|nr:hypothetical protein [Candidatus Eremiobacteraeota bacterium]